MTGTLKSNIFSENVQIPSFYFKNNKRKPNFGIQKMFYICLGPQNGNIDF